MVAARSSQVPAERRRRQQFRRKRRRKARVLVRDNHSSGQQQQYQKFCRGKCGSDDDSISLHPYPLRLQPSSSCSSANLSRINGNMEQVMMRKRSRCKPSPLFRVIATTCLFLLMSDRQLQGAAAATSDKWPGSETFTVASRSYLVLSSQQPQQQMVDISSQTSSGGDISKFAKRQVANQTATTSTHQSLNSSSDDEQMRKLNYERLMKLKQKYEINRAISDKAYHSLLIAYSVLIIFGTTCNSLICLTVILKPSILSPRNIIIVNLAVSDLMLCIFTMPFSFIEISMKVWHLGNIFCKLAAGLQATSIFVSTISITAIALDRYKVIVYPVHQESNRGTRRAVVLLVCVWIGALLLSSPLFYFRSVLHFTFRLPQETKHVELCVESWPIKYGRGLYSVITMILQYVLPITIVSVVYAKISDKLKKRLIRRQRLTQMEWQQKRQLTLIRRTHAMLISVSLIFGLSWLPLYLLNVIGDFSSWFNNQDEQLYKIIFAICHLIGCSSACTNPILYAYLNENFRKECHQVYVQHARRLADLFTRPFRRQRDRCTSGSFKVHQVASRKDPELGSERVAHPTMTQSQQRSELEYPSNNNDKQASLRSHRQLVAATLSMDSKVNQGSDSSLSIEKAKQQNGSQEAARAPEASNRTSGHSNERCSQQSAANNNHYSHLPLLSLNGPSRSNSESTAAASAKSAGNAKKRDDNDDNEYDTLQLRADRSQRQASLDNVKSHSEFCEESAAGDTRRCSTMTTTSSSGRGQPPFGATMRFCLCIRGSSSIETVNQQQQQQQQSARQAVVGARTPEAVTGSGNSPSAADRHRSGESACAIKMNQLSASVAREKRKRRRGQSAQSCDDESKAQIDRRQSASCSCRCHIGAATDNSKAADLVTTDKSALTGEGSVTGERRADGPSEQQQQQGRRVWLRFLSGGARTRSTAAAAAAVTLDNAAWQSVCTYCQVNCCNSGAGSIKRDASAVEADGARSSEKCAGDQLGSPGIAGSAAVAAAKYNATRDQRTTGLVIGQGQEKPLLKVAPLSHESAEVRMAKAQERQNYYLSIEPIVLFGARSAATLSEISRERSTSLLVLDDDFDDSPPSLTAAEAATRPAESVTNATAVQVQSAAITAGDDARAGEQSMSHQAAACDQSVTECSPNATTLGDSGRSSAPDDRSSFPANRKFAADGSQRRAQRQRAGDDKLIAQIPDATGARQLAATEVRGLLTGSVSETAQVVGSQLDCLTKPLTMYCTACDADSASNSIASSSSAYSCQLNSTFTCSCSSSASSASSSGNLSPAEREPMASSGEHMTVAGKEQHPQQHQQQQHQQQQQQQQQGDQELAQETRTKTTPNRLPCRSTPDPLVKAPTTPQGAAKQTPGAERSAKCKRCSVSLDAPPTPTTTSTADDADCIATSLSAVSTPFNSPARSTHSSTSLEVARLMMATATPQEEEEEGSEEQVGGDLNQVKVKVGVEVIDINSKISGDMTDVLFKANKQATNASDSLFCCNGKLAITGDDGDDHKRA